jgi:hypothetical protein
MSQSHTMGGAFFFRIYHFISNTMARHKPGCHKQWLLKFMRVNVAPSLENEMPAGSHVGNE